MFTALSDKLQRALHRLGRKGKLSEQDVDEALREVRLALLEADVHFRVVRGFVERVRQRAQGSEVLQSLAPAHQVVKIVHEELVALLGEPGGLLSSPRPPTVLMLVGLQGSGKTTTAAKLALHLRQQGQHPLLVAADPYRPAAVAQLQILGSQVEVPVFGEPGPGPGELCRAAVERARSAGQSPVILDTAGRLHTDEELMKELGEIQAAVEPTEMLLVVDGSSGQDALQVAEVFHQRVGLTGVILTKMDGDARGGAALSLREVTGVPIKFLGVGERVDALEPLRAERLAGRILGMGDVLSLVERAQRAFDGARARELERKIGSATLNLEDLLEQLHRVQRAGPLDELLALVPGLGRGLREVDLSLGDKEVRKAEAMILSMTPAERRRPEIIGASRRRRIARGSGTSPAEVNRLLSQFRQMQQVMKGLARRRQGPGLGKLFP